MNKDKLIPANDFCSYHNIEYSFIDSLENSGLIRITSVEHTPFIEEDELEKLEKFVRMHYELEINVAGLETISYLLEKMERLQKEVVRLKNHLANYPSVE